MTEETSPVAILLSTWNGAAYLPDQLASFPAQTHARWTIHWRDDGSDDATPALVRAFAAAHPGRVVDCCDGRGRIGVLASFLALLRHAPADGITAFADQDDVWLPEKLARGAASLARVPDDVPGLYCARQVLVDASLRRLGLSPRVRGAPNFPQSLTQNVATGCTVMMNGAATRLLAAAAPPEHSLHDWWAFLLVTAAGGRVLFDATPTVLYRQHRTNLVGVPGSAARRGLAALHRGPGAFMRTFRAHVAALAAQPGLLSAEGRAEIARIAGALAGGAGSRLRALALPGFRRQTFAETQLFRIWFLLG